MKTEHKACAVRFLAILVLAPALLLGVTGCGGGYSAGSGGGGGGGGGGQSPTITSLSPTFGAVGTPVIIAGNYFGATPGSSTVTFSGTAATATSWSNTTIDVSVPAGATSGNVVVTVGGVASNGVNFTVTSSGGGSSSGWQYLQDDNLIFCQGSGKTSCTPGLGQIAPTTAGSVWILQAQMPNNVTITSVNPGSGGGTWIQCTACHVTNPSGFTEDVWYNLTGNAGFNGASPFGFTLSGSAGTFLGANFIELLPPAGSTASVDTVGTAAPNSCTTCIGPTLTLTATDAVWMNPGGNSQAKWNSSGPPPFFLDYNGGTIGLNLPPGTVTPQTTYDSNSQPAFVAMAFKSTAGTFTPPTARYSIVQFLPTAGTPTGSACSTCTLTLPQATGAGNLLFVEAASQFGAFITGVNDGHGGVWAAPSGANTCRLGGAITGVSSAMASCAYLLSSAAGITTLTITMSGSSSANFGVWEVSSSTGAPFTVDAQGSAYQSTTTNFYPNGVPFTGLKDDDVIFQTGWLEGGSLGPTSYPYPAIDRNATLNIGPANYIMFNEYSVATALDVKGPNPTTPVWINPQHDSTIVTAMAFNSP